MTELKNDRGASIGAAALAQLFTEARTHNAFLAKPVSDTLLVEAMELAKMGPTAANTQPLRVLFLRSQEAKERLRIGGGRPHLCEFHRFDEQRVGHGLGEERVVGARLGEQLRQGGGAD